MFSGVEPFTRAAEMPSGALTDKIGCLFKKDRSHFLPAADFFFVKWMIQAISYCQLKSHVFMS